MGKSISKLLGDRGERIACEYLVENGYKILGRNYSISFGEIDIIARKKFKLFAGRDRAIHFIEVKTLKASNPQLIFPESHVDFRKRSKLRQMAQIWLENKSYPQDFPYQIDIIGILIDENSMISKVHYFPNAVPDVDKSAK